MNPLSGDSYRSWPLRADAPIEEFIFLAKTPDAEGFERMRLCFLGYAATILLSMKGYSLPSF